MWPKGVALTPEHLWILVRKPGGTLVRVRDAPPDGLLHFKDGVVVQTHWDAFRTLFEAQFPHLAQMIGLAEIAEDRDEFFVLRLGDCDSPLEVLHRGTPAPLYLRWELADPPEMHQVLSMEYTGRAVVNVAEVRLTHKRFAQSNVAYGEAPIGGRDALFVLTEDEHSGRLSIRFRSDRTPRSSRLTRLQRLGMPKPRVRKLQSRAGAGRQPEVRAAPGIEEHPFSETATRHGTIAKRRQTAFTAACRCRIRSPASAVRQR
jgi:hypothetical protein